ncbi:MAG: RdgB/HAM1 family non-canonical purine NTP pyrophosphatase [Chloroflexota bacterium]
MKSLLLATQNPGKTKEMKALLGVLPLNLIMPQELDLQIAISEDGSTYAENAAHKALAYAQASTLPTIADDSGLEVEALDGSPGIHSARFAPWSEATDADRRCYLLEQLQPYPRPWKARFRCTVALATPRGEIYFTEGICTGEIIPTERGTHGFGYDPIFYLPQQGLTMAELPTGVKNTLSHRARAVQAAIPIIKKVLDLPEGK